MEGGDDYVKAIKDNDMSKLRQLVAAGKVDKGAFGTAAWCNNPTAVCVLLDGGVDPTCSDGPT